jgi:Ser/Thr protein kinase RdoA (MazF antagonist)
MSKEIEFQQRIDYQGDIKPLMSKVCSDYQIGDYHSRRVVPTGYEDFNLILETSKDKFFVKVFAKFRDIQECQRYIDILTHVLEAGVAHPALYKSPQGYLYEVYINDTPVRLCVLQFIDGKSFYKLKAKPTTEEMRFLVQQAVKINSVDFNPAPLYDSWAIVKTASFFLPLLIILLYCQ